MQFEPPPNPYSNPFYPSGFGYASPPPTGMPPRAAQAFFENGYGVPTPAPSPRTPSSSRRRSATADFMNSPDYASGKSRPSSSRRATSGLGDHAEYPHEVPYNPSASPRPGAGHRGPFMHTPLHTPPPFPHAHTPMPNIYSYVPGFSPTQAEYFSYTPAPGPQSPPPQMRDGRRSRSHHRQTWTGSGENTPRSPSKSTKPSPTPAPQAAPEKPSMDDALRRKKATEAGIPADYSLKNWDPTETPIILLGSVFDANSLGEWVFNWTKYHHGRQHEATRTAGGLWELLIELSSKLKRAREFANEIQTADNREIIADFMESGERLWGKLTSLLKSCEEYMWTGARRVASPDSKDGKTKVQMGRQSGAEFVDAMFNGEKEYEKTERLMRGMYTWCKRFEVNCEEILRKPDA